jgi:uncharacterized protein
MNKQDLKRIKDLSIYNDWNVSFGGSSRGNKHLFRVVKIAHYLAKKENADYKIVEAGAWLHDIGLTVGNDNDPKQIRQIAESFLENLNIQDPDKSKIADCVESHEGMIKAKNIEAKVVHDADVLDKRGFLGIIRHTWKLTNLIASEATPEENFDTLSIHLKWRKQKLYTKTAKSIIAALDVEANIFFKDRARSVKIVEDIMQLARAGITTEKIAKRLDMRLNPEYRKSIESQLNCTYLPQ